MRNYHQYLRNEEVDWNWDYDSKAKIHKLTLVHLPTKKQVSGELHDAKVPRGKLTEKKRELQDDLHSKLEELVYE